MKKIFRSQTLWFTGLFAVIGAFLVMNLLSTPTPSTIAQEWELPPPPTAPPVPQGDELEQLIQKNAPELVESPIRGTNMVYIGKHDELAVEVPGDLVVSGLIVTSVCPSSMANACVKAPFYLLSPVDSLGDDNPAPPVVLAVEKETGKVWPDKTQSKEYQEAQLEKYDAFIKQMPSEPAAPGAPIW